MATKVAKTGVKREKGWLYYLDKKGNVSRARMARGGGKPASGKPQEVAKAGVRPGGRLPLLHRPRRRRGAHQDGAPRRREPPGAGARAAGRARRCAGRSGRSRRGARLRARRRSAKRARR